MTHRFTQIIRKIVNNIKIHWKVRKVNIHHTRIKFYIYSIEYAVKPGVLFPTYVHLVRGYPSPL